MQSRKLIATSDGTHVEERLERYQTEDVNTIIPINVDTIASSRALVNLHQISALHW